MVSALTSHEQEIVDRLLKGGKLTVPMLQRCRMQAVVCGEPLVHSLVANDILSEEELAQMLAEMYELRFLDLSRRSVSEPWVLALPENFLRQRLCLPIGEIQGQLVVAVADPGDRTLVSEIRSRIKKPVQLVVSPRYQILEQLNRVCAKARHRGARLAGVNRPISTLSLTNVSGMSMVELVDSIIDEAVDRRASDVHIEPEKDRVRVRLRIDGQMVEARAYPLETHSAIVSRVKVMANLDITERRVAQDGRFAHRSFDQDIDVRVAIIPTVHGERVTLRLLGVDHARLGFGELGMDLEVEQAFRRMIHRPYGIILLTGPTGSGKTTTLYTALHEINTIDKHIITIEDPVEYQIPGVNQVQIDEEHGVTFAGALRSIVRHDPDVIMVGEIRDRDTAHLALEASLTGHLVFATLHTNSAVGAITRLIEMGCEPYLIASGVIAVMAQRLVRRICERCKVGERPTETERELLGIPPERTEVRIWRGKGCARCLRTGYYDRIGIYEFVPFTPGLGELVMQKAPTDVMHRYAIEHGARTLRMDAFSKVLRGLTTLEEALRVTSSDIL